MVSRTCSQTSPAMDSETRPLHMLFFPLMAAGHMLPMANMARMFSSRGVKATILTTPANAPLIRSCIGDSSHHLPIDLELVPFPSAAVGLPEGLESHPSIASPEMTGRFQAAVEMLRQPFDRVLRELLPDCVVTDMFLPWTLDVASELGIPRLVFPVTCFFSLCASDSLERHSIPPDTESFVLPGLPHQITMLRSQVPNWKVADPAFLESLKKIKESEERSYGVVVNSFYELEPDYANHYLKVLGRKAWTVGPVSLFSKDEDVGMPTGGEACLKWLDSKASGSVVYVCFGSLSEFPAAQLREVAVGLEASGHPFVWVVRDGGHEWLPEGFEERNEGKGLLIRGWSPQILILNHPAVGGFVTHCGWNSCLEGVAGGVPMVTWPLFAEQFLNEKLVVDVLGIGVSVGAKKFLVLPEDWEVVVAAEVETAVRGLMGDGEEAEGRRRKARELKKMARRAVEEDDGSSYVYIGNLITELMDGRNRNYELQSIRGEADLTSRE